PERTAPPAGQAEVSGLAGRRGEEEVEGHRTRTGPAGPADRGGWRGTGLLLPGLGRVRARHPDAPTGRTGHPDRQRLPGPSSGGRSAALGLEGAQGFRGAVRPGPEQPEPAQCANPRKKTPSRSSFGERQRETRRNLSRKASGGQPGEPTAFSEFD